MPYGNPTPGDRSYRLVVTSASPVGGGPLRINCTFNVEDMNGSGMEAAFQSLVDVIANSGSFIVSDAGRQQIFNETVTRTPAS
ncbi:hypothetical protein [Streptomyces sp. NPDC127072]|uniref:hypothetical protein n=1 Tax=Streptomyces sp. NPDC127072 TaxID=3347129 RepID=UPI003664E38C